MKEHQDKSVGELKKLSKKLYRACGQRSPDLAEIQRLIDDGASVNYDTGFLETATPMVAAFKKWNREVLKLLIDNGASVSRYMMFKAAEKGDLELVKLMTARDYSGFDSTYALHAAIEKGHLDVARHLIDNKAMLDLTVGGTKKLVVLDMAERNGREDVIAFVKDAIEQKEARARREELEREEQAKNAPRSANDRLAELERLVREQAGEITALRERVDALENPGKVVVKIQKPGLS